MLLILITILFGSCKEIIAFYLITQTFSPGASKLILPKDTETTTIADLSKPANRLTIILGANDKIYTYEGEFNVDNLQKKSYKTIRDFINESKNKIGNNHITIVIKPSSSSSYRNTIDILDEMTINDIKHYALLDITAEEEKALENFKNR